MSPSLSIWGAADPLPLLPQQRAPPFPPPSSSGACACIFLLFLWRVLHRHIERQGCVYVCACVGHWARRKAQSLSSYETYQKGERGTARNRTTKREGEGVGLGRLRSSKQRKTDFTLPFSIPLPPLHFSPSSLLLATVENGAIQAEKQEKGVKVFSSECYGEVR